MTPLDRARACLQDLYDDPAVYDRLLKLVDRYRSAGLPSATATLSEADAILITYGDQVQAPNQPPLQTLGAFCKRWLPGVVSGVHILPFYPWTSDDGFSVKDYAAIDPALGSWADVEGLGADFRPMFDAVINHISAESEWFRAFRRDQPPYRDYFIAVDGDPDLSQVVRPRALPLLTPVETSAGPKRVWTTFSADQIDLNFKNPDVLLEVLDALLLYAAKGAHFIRLDAIAYLWKEIGTSCIHLPQTHRAVQLMRAVLDELAPNVRLITETNVPHTDNISYFGDGSNEAQLVYNFALPPLTLHTLQSEDATSLAEWARALVLPSRRVTFFNFLASHDGIGVNPARGILSAEQIAAMIDRVRAHGGLVSYKNNPDGSQSPYELNVNYFDALSDPQGNEPIETQVARFVAAHAIMFSVVGVPGIYFHSLFGSRGWPAGVAETGRNRTINRQKLPRAQVEAELGDARSLRHQVFARLSALLTARASSPAFHPHGTQRVLSLGSQVLGLRRTSPDSAHQVLCLQNVTGRTQVLEMGPLTDIASGARTVRDLISGAQVDLGSQYRLKLNPFQTLWLAL